MCFISKYALTLATLGFIQFKTMSAKTNSYGKYCEYYPDYPDKGNEKKT